MDIAKYIDHTFLKAEGEPDAVRRLCREAKRFGFASVCVNPSDVKLAARLLKGSGVAVCSVVGFPLGRSVASVKFCEAAGALCDGATELDFVINIGLLKAAARGGKAALEELRRELDLCVSVKGAEFTEMIGISAPVLKLIIECCYLTDDEKVFACRMAKEAGFDFVKTSTGFGAGGATVHDVKLMRRAVGKKMGVKAAGGIRTREDALAMIAAGATRLGCSAGVAIVGAAAK